LPLVRKRRVRIVLILILALTLLMSIQTLRAQTPGSTPGPNKQLDSPNLYGVEPYVAVGPDGTIHVAWMDSQFDKPTTYYDQGPQFTTWIYYSYSTDGGKTFAHPIPVDSEASYGDPSIALAPNGNVLVAYISSTNGAAVAVKSPSSTTFHLAASLGKPGAVDRPWIATAPNGDIYLIWNEVRLNTDMELGTRWAVSKDGVTFSTPAHLTDFPDWTTGLVVGGDSTIHVVMLGWSGNSNYPDEIIYANKPSTSSTFQSQVLSGFSDPYSLDNLGSRTIFLPGPALAVEGSNVYLVFSSNLGKSLLLKSSSDGGATWSIPSQIRSSTGLMQMPWLSIRKGVLFLDWLETSNGYWNTYCGVISNGLLSQPLKLSDQNGYPAEVLNWHGDFTTNAFVSNKSVAVLWSDGRGLANYYGYGHIYMSIVSLNELTPVPEFQMPAIVVAFTIGLAGLFLTAKRQSRTCG
jgi:hypothetical protein